MNMTTILRKHPTFTAHALIQQMCQPLAQFGITFFGHGRVSNDKTTFLGSDPKWASYFIAEGHKEHTALFYETTASEHILLADNLPRKGKSKAILDAFYSHGYGHLMTIIRTNEQGREIFHFAGNPDDHQLNNRYLWHLNDIKKFINFFNCVAKKDRWLKAKDQMLVPMPAEGKFELEDGYNQLNCGTLQTNGLSNQKKYYRDTHLTKREFECLHWLAMGKTQTETALILDITTRTVQAHIDNIKTKTNCRNQVQLGILYEKLNNQLQLTV